MAEEYTVTEVRLVRHTMPGAQGKTIVREQWHVGLERPDGARGTHIIPVEAFAGRAAEYWAVDEPQPTVDELLDIILHEPYIPAEELATRRTVETLVVATADGVQEQPTAQVRTAPAARPVTVHTARDHAEARAAHLARIDAAKQRVRIVPPRPAAAPVGRLAAKPPADPLDVIRQRATISPDHVAEIRGMVAQAREHAARGAAPATLQGNPVQSARLFADVPPEASPPAAT